MTTVRPFTIAAVTAGAGYILEGVIAIIHPVGDTHWGTFADVLNISFLVAVLASAFVLPYIGRWLGVNPAGQVAVTAAQIGFAAMAVETVVSLVHGGNTLGAVFFIGLVLVTLATLVLAITGLLAGVVRWAAPLPFIGWLVSIAGGDHGGSILLGMLCLGAAATIVRTREPVLAQHPSNLRTATTAAHAPGQDH